MFNIQEVMLESIVMYASSDPIPVGYAPCDGGIYNGVTTVNIPVGHYLKQDSASAVGLVLGMSTAMPTSNLGGTSSESHTHTASGDTNLSVSANHNHNTANTTARTYTHSVVNRGLNNGANFTFANISNGTTTRTVTVNVSGTLSNTGTHSHNIASYTAGNSGNSSHSHEVSGGDAVTEPNNVQVRYIMYVGV